MLVPSRVSIFNCLVAFGLLALLSQVTDAEDLIWYRPNDDYTGHNYGWQGTTDGKSAPELLLASVINQPWLLTISQSKNIIYWSDNRGIIGAWDVSSQRANLIYQIQLGNWDESSKGPALTGLDVDELNNHLYFSFNRSIYRLDLNQVNTSPLLIGSYSNLVFNPRFSSSRNSLFFCLRNNFEEQGDLVQVSLSSPTTVTTLVHNTSTGSIVQQLFIDDTTNTLYYNSPGTLTMRGVSLIAPYNEVFKSIYLGTNPTFFDFNPTTTTFVFSDLTFSTAKLWSLGPSAPTTIYKPSYGRVTGVKLFNDTHALVAYQYPGNSANPSQGYLTLVNVNNPNDTSVLLQHFGMGKSLIFDEKKCDFYYVLNRRGSSTTDQRIFKKNIKAQEPSLYSNEVTINYSGMSGIAFDAQKRNLIISSSLNGSNVFNYLPIDNPNNTPVQIIDSKGRSISSYVVNDKTGDIFYTAYEGYYYSIYRLEASTISKDWINNVGHQIIGPIKTVRVISMAIDSENNKFYFTNGSTIVQSNLDGSDMRTLYDLSDKQSSIRSMKWDPTSNRLYFLATPKSGWIMASVNNNGLNFISTPLNASTSSGRDIFSSISPDPYSDWVYMNAEYYQPLRIKKDGSAFESLYSYIPFYNQAESLAFDEATNSLYYSDVNCLIKKINLNSVIPDDPSATPFEVAWQGNNTCSYANFIHDRFNKVFWLLQGNQGKNLSFAVTPVNGRSTKQLFAFPNNVFSPFAVDSIKSNLFAYYYTVDRWNSRQNQAIVKMDLYNGTNLRTVKDFNNRNYSGFILTAMTFDSRTNLLYYGLNANGAAVLESFDPVTYQTQRLWYAKKALYIRDLKVKGSSIYIATYYGNIFAFDLKNGTATDLLVPATAISLNPGNNDIYMAASYVISSANLKNVNATKTALLTSFAIQNLVFDFVGRSAYCTTKGSTVRATPPYYYRVDLDGANKKRMQVENSFYVPAELKQLSLVNNKFYVGNGNVDSFNIDGSGYTSIMQAMYVSGNIQYDEASQRVYWQENYGRWFFSCAVYSTKYADCRGYQLFSDMQYVITSVPQLNGFAIGKNGMAYFTAQYKNVIYQMDLDIGVSSLKVFVSDQRLSYGYGITTDKAKSALYVAVITPYLANTSPLILRVGLDGTITTLYSNITSSSYILSADLSHCK